MSKPDYIRHQLSEDQITIDWFFTTQKNRASFASISVNWDWLVNVLCTDLEYNCALSNS